MTLLAKDKSFQHFFEYQIEAARVIAQVPEPKKSGD